MRWRPPSGPYKFVNECSPIYLVNISTAEYPTIHSVLGISSLKRSDRTYYKFTLVYYFPFIVSIRFNYSLIQSNSKTIKYEGLYFSSRVQFDDFESASLHRISSECCRLCFGLYFRSSSRFLESCSNSHYLF